MLTNVIDTKGRGYRLVVQRGRLAFVAVELFRSPRQVQQWLGDRGLPRAWMFPVTDGVEEPEGGWWVTRRPTPSSPSS